MYSSSTSSYFYSGIRAPISPCQRGRVHLVYDSCTHITLNPTRSITYRPLPISSPFPINAMSTSRNKNLSISTFQSIFDAAVKEYQKKTRRDLRTHPLAAEFNHCNSPNAILDIFQKQADALDQAGKSNQTLVKWLSPTIHLLYTFSATIAEGAGLVSLTECVLCVSVFHKHSTHRRSLLQK